MKFRLLLLVAFLFLTPALARAQGLAYYPFRAGPWGGGPWGGGAWGGANWGGGYWGGGPWGWGDWGGGLYSPYSYGGWGTSPYNLGWGMASSYNPGYSLRAFSESRTYSGPVVVDVIMAGEIPRMRCSICPAIAPPSRQTIRAALESN